MTDIDAVAAALIAELRRQDRHKGGLYVEQIADQMWIVDGGVDIPSLARAAVDALQLTEEHRTQQRYADYMRIPEVWRRLVGPWVRCPEDDR